MAMEPDELRDAVVYQIGGLDAVARAAGSAVAYVKPHGALYHSAAGDPGVAAAVVDGVCAVSASLAVLGLPDSELLGAAARLGLRAVPEGFADRAYHGDGSLVSRRVAGAVLTDPVAIAARVVRLVEDGVVETADGGTVGVAAESVCVHGDTPGSVRIAEAVRAALDERGIAVSPFVG